MTAFSHRRIFHHPLWSSKLYLPATKGPFQIWPIPLRTFAGEETTFHAPCFKGESRLWYVWNWGGNRNNAAFTVNTKMQIRDQPTFRTLTKCFLCQIHHHVTSVPSLLTICIQQSVRWRCMTHTCRYVCINVYDCRTNRPIWETRKWEDPTRSEATTNPIFELEDSTDRELGGDRKWVYLSKPAWLVYYTHFVLNHE